MSDQQGPDRILPASALRTWDVDGAVKLRVSNEPPADMQPISVPTFVKRRCEANAAYRALLVKRAGKWVEWTYKQYYDDIVMAAKAFVKLGLQRFHTVSIYGFNSPEWFIADIAAIFAGGLATGLYPTNSADACEFIMSDSSTDILVVEDAKALDKLYLVAKNVPTLKKIVVYNGEGPFDYPDVLSWEQLMDMGRACDDAPLQERIQDQAINQCCTLIYTSGTTGNPKGVMLSHDNILFTCHLATYTLGWHERDERVVSYLPLSHIAAQMVDLWGPMFLGTETWFADKMALKGTLLDTMREVRPTRFFGVPRVWEKFMEGMRDKGRDIKGLKKTISTKCKEAGIQHHLHNKDGIMWKFGQKAIYPKVKEALGLDKCRHFYTGAAPIAQETLVYFLSLDIVILELFGMTEVTGPHCINTLPRRRLGSCGPVCPSLKVMIKDKGENGDGELLLGGRNVMMGYLNREDKTIDDLDDDGWIHSGDIGSVDEQGFVYITGRIKELLITAGGENIAPVPIEDVIKEHLPAMSNAILIGDKRKFLTCFLTFKTVVDASTDAPTKTLSPSAVAWCADVGSSAKTMDDVLRRPDVNIMRAIQKGMDSANAMATSNACRIQKWTILPVDVSIPGGELGPTLKLKRFAFNKKYMNAIDRFYD